MDKTIKSCLKYLYIACNIPMGLIDQMYYKFDRVE